MRQVWETRDASTVISLVRWNTDLSHTALARMTGLGQSTISEIISGKVELKHQVASTRCSKGSGYINDLEYQPWLSPSYPGVPSPQWKNYVPPISPRTCGDRSHKSQKPKQCTYCVESIGVNLYTLVMRYLTSRVGPALLSEDGGPRTFIAAAGLTEMAGWMPHDTRHQLAARHFSTRPEPGSSRREDTTLALVTRRSRLTWPYTERRLRRLSASGKHGATWMEERLPQRSVLAMLTALTLHGRCRHRPHLPLLTEHLLSVPALPPRSGGRARSTSPPWR